MNPYDQAHVLAAVLKRCDEYTAYREAKDAVFANEDNRQMVRLFKKKQFQAQAMALSGEKPDEDLMEELKNLTNILQFNAEIGAFLQAEYRINQLMGDIFKILGEAVDLDLDFMNDPEE